MFERFTDSARATVVAAQETARELGHSEIGAEHLLLALVTDETGAAAQVLRDLHVDAAALRAEVQAVNSPDAEALRTLGIDLDEVRRRAEASFGAGALSRPRRQRRGLFGHRFSSGGHLRFTSEARSALENSLHDAVSLRHAYIGSEHLLLGLLTTAAGTAGQLLRRVGVTSDAAAVRQLVLEALRRTA